jgi:MFS transporter, OFA family, oxalate/formate antiporter
LHDYGFFQSKHFYLIINSDRPVDRMGSENQASESSALTLFGMSPEKGRWIFVALGLAINVCLGSIYSWSVFGKPLQSFWSIDATLSLMPFIFFLAFFALLMPFAGGPLDRYGPRRLTVLGGIIVGIGWILASQAPNIAVLTLAYGIIGGAGVGIAYNAPIGVSGRWFPDRRGLAVGLTVLGFGISPLITAPLANYLISKYGVLSSLGILGIAFLILIVVLALPLRFPDPNWKPKGWTQEQAAARCEDLNRPQMVRTRGFWGLWLGFFIGTLAGLMAIGISSQTGQEAFGLSATTTAAFVGVFAVFNGIGRPIFGYLVDRIYPRNAAMLSFVIIAAAAILLGFGAAPSATWVYIVGFCALWLCLGGWLAIAPSCTAAFCGTKYYGPNYGLVFTAYGAGAIVGNLLAGQLRDIFGSYVAVFYPVALLAIAGIVISFFLIRQPSQTSHEEGGA